MWIIQSVLAHVVRSTVSRTFCSVFVDPRSALSLFLSPNENSYLPLGGKKGVTILCFISHRAPFDTAVSSAFAVISPEVSNEFPRPRLAGV